MILPDNNDPELNVKVLVEPDVVLSVFWAPRDEEPTNTSTWQAVPFVPYVNSMLDTSLKELSLSKVIVLPLPIDEQVNWIPLSL